MHTHLIRLLQRPLAATLLCLAGLHAQPARAAAPSSAPQVLLAITNSESMDGSTAGAIMVGSGKLSSGGASLSDSSSPASYTIPTGFTPPLDTGDDGKAPYTVSCGSYLCDNGPSRLNLAKAAIKQMLASYGSTLNFGLYTYSTSGLGAYLTWVYYMSPVGGFTFTNSAGTNTVDNPCYQYDTAASSTVQSNCTSLATRYGGDLKTKKYMTIAISSDDPFITDVLYAPASLGIPSVFISYGTVTPANPYTTYPLTTYNTSLSSFLVRYSKTLPSIGSWATAPTNAGYVPYTPEVMYALRGFGYGAAQSATTGKTVVAMNTDPASSTAFTEALAPETNSSASKEIKAAAGQSSIAGLLAGAKSYLGGLSKASCQAQYVVLVTDGQPTMDLAGKAWPPLGTATASAYAVTATFNPDGSYASSNSQAVKDTMTSLAALAAAGVKTYVIGLGAGVDSSVNPTAAKLLKAMAIAGGTADFFPATSAASLNTALSTIASQIYGQSAIAAPVAPLSVADGNGFEYSLTTTPTPQAGHVQAYPVASDGTPGTTVSWDAGASMNATNRATALKAANASGAITTLDQIDAAAFSLTATTCVPDTARIVSYTIDPSYTASSCSYLAGRQSGWFLGGFSTQNTGRYVGPPASSLLLQQSSSYVTYARARAGRTPMVLFTNNDGFLYAINAKTGALLWGWTSRSLLAKLQNYSTFQSSGATDGNFTVVDALDGSNNWGTYLVGSFQSGAQHFSVKLDSSGAPSAVVYDQVISSGVSAGDKAGATGATPLRQPTVVAYVKGSAYALYVVTVGTTSTLYEANVATGAVTSAALPFQVSSVLHHNATTNQLWMGGTDGTVRIVSNISGSAATDLLSMQTVGTTRHPTTSAVVMPVLYVGYAEVKGIPYTYALNAGQISVWGVTTKGWTPLWTATTSAGYTYNGTAYTATTGLSTLTGSSVVSDLPLVIGNALLVPTYVASSGCGAGSGYYDFFTLASGTFPSNLAVTYNSTAITTHMYIGAGPAFTPSSTLNKTGVSFNPGTTGTLNPQKPLQAQTRLGSAPLSWRQQQSQ